MTICSSGLHCVRTLDGCDRVAVGAARAGLRHAHRANDDRPILKLVVNERSIHAAQTPRAPRGHGRLLGLTHSRSSCLRSRPRCSSRLGIGCVDVLAVQDLQPCGASVTRTGSEHGGKSARRRGRRRSVRGAPPGVGAYSRKPPARMRSGASRLPCRPRRRPCFGRFPSWLLVVKVLLRAFYELRKTIIGSLFWALKLFRAALRSSDSTSCFLVSRKRPKRRRKVLTCTSYAFGAGL